MQTVNIKNYCIRGAKVKNYISIQYISAYICNFKRVSFKKWYEISVFILSVYARGF